MIVTCPSCTARYRLKDSKVTGRGAKITCPSCSYVFIVYPSEEASSAASSAASAAPAAAVGGGSSAVVRRPPGKSVASLNTPEPARAPKHSAEDLDFRRVGINAWKVKVKIGLTYDFADIKTLRKFIQDGRVTGEDNISHDGRTWVTIGDIPDLDAYFIDIYEKAEAERESSSAGGGGFEDEDAPTMIVGMSSLSNDLAADALRQATSSSDGFSSDPPSAHTPSGEGHFVDPFAALKSKQRERIQQRRSATAAPPARKEEPEGASRALPLLLLFIIVVGAGAWWYTQGRDQAVEAPPTPDTPVQPAETPEGSEVTQPTEGAADDLRRMVEESLQDGAGDPLPLDEEPVLIPVGPRGDGPSRPNGNPSGSNGGANNGAGTSGITTSSADHSANCKQFARTGLWSQASMACAEALKTQPGDAGLLAAHGIALYETGSRDAAASKLKAADRGGVPSAKKYLGHIARDNGDVAGAIGHYNAYIATNPSDRGAIQAEIDRLTGS